MKDEMNFSEMLFNRDERLLDYITNLQEELKSANESISWWQNRFNTVEKENKRYKRIFEGKERFSKTMPDDTDFIILSKADYDRQQEDIELELIDYKSRNEKAIEYNQQIIKDTKEFYRPTEDIIYSGDTLIDIAMNNINILQGGDE